MREFPFVIKNIDETRQRSIAAAIQAATDFKESTINVVNNRDEKALSLEWDKHLAAALGEAALAADPTAAVVLSGHIDLAAASRGGCGIVITDTGNGSHEWIEGVGLHVSGSGQPMSSWLDIPFVWPQLPWSIRGTLSEAVTPTVGEYAAIAVRMDGITFWGGVYTTGTPELLSASGKDSAGATDPTPIASPVKELLLGVSHETLLASKNAYLYGGPNVREIGVNTAQNATQIADIRGAKVLPALVASNHTFTRIF